MHDPERTLERGERVEGRFEIAGVLGQGATSIVYEAHDLALDRAVALKVLRASIPRGSIAGARLEREAQLVARLDHPSIVRLFASGWRAETGQPWLALERLRGETLESLLAREGRLPPARALALLDPVLDALEAAHAARILHRDLKPANLFVVSAADRERPVILDFGVGRDLADHGPRLTAPAQVVGTLAYLAPEQIDPARGEPDERSDLWAIGVVLYRALTGQTPFGRGTRVVAGILEREPAPPSALLPALPRELDGVIARALSKKRDERFASAAELRAALAALSPA